MSAISFKHASRFTLGFKCRFKLKKKKTKRRKKHTSDSFQLSINPPITDQYIMLIISRIVFDNAKSINVFLLVFFPMQTRILSQIYLHIQIYHPSVWTLFYNHSYSCLHCWHKCVHSPRCSVDIRWNLIEK